MDAVLIVLLVLLLCPSVVGFAIRTVIVVVAVVYVMHRMEAYQAPAPARAPVRQIYP